MGGAERSLLNSVRTNGDASARASGLLFESNTSAANVQSR